MSLITDPRVESVREACAKAGVKVSVAARPSKADPSGCKLYFKLSGSKVIGSGNLGDDYARGCVKFWFPKAYNTSGGWGLSSFEITMTEY